MIYLYMLTCLIMCAIVFALGAATLYIVCLINSVFIRCITIAFAFVDISCLAKKLWSIILPKILGKI